MQKVWAAAVLSPLLLALPVQAAEQVPVHGTIEARGSTVLHGLVEATADLSMVRFDSFFDGGSASATLEIPRGRFFLLNQPFTFFSSQTPGSELRQDYPAEELENRSIAGILKVETARDNATLRIMPGGPEPLRLHFAATGSKNITRNLPPGSDGFIPTFRGKAFTSNAPAGNLQSAQALDAPLGGPVQMLFYGTDLLLEEAEGIRLVQTGRFPRASGSADDPTGNARVRSYDDIFAVVIAEDATVKLDSADSRGWHYHASAMDGRLSGDIAFEAITAATTVDHALLRDDFGLFQLVGDLDFRASFDDAGATWAVDGMATFVATDGRTIHGQRAGVEAAVAGGLGLLGLAIALARYGQDLLVLTGFSRHVKLESNSRLRLLRFLAEHPAATPMEVARGTGFHRSTVNFHLAVLRRAGMIDVERQGRFDHILLKEARTETAAADSGPLGVVVHAALRHPIRGRILQTLSQASAPQSYNDLAAAWGADGRVLAGRTLFQHHASKLERSGLLRRQRIGRRTAWTVEPGCLQFLQGTAGLPAPRGGLPDAMVSKPQVELPARPWDASKVGESE